MRRSTAVSALIVWLVGALPHAVGAQRSLLEVGTKEAPPFSYRDSAGDWQGISVELWRRLADDQGLDFRWQEADVEGLLSGLQDGSLDIAVGALTVTAEREERIDFTHPYFSSGLGVLVREIDRMSWLLLLRRLVSLEFVKVLLGLTVLLAVAGTCVWWFERRANPEQFGGGVARGIGEGFWWAAVTMTTVGYGDRAPKTLGGRAVSLVWMFASLVVLGSFLASLASTLAVDQLSGLVHKREDLASVRVGTVAGTASAELAAREELSGSAFPTLDAAIAALEAHQVDAVVHDRPLLAYSLRSGHPRLRLLDLELTSDFYALALPEGSPLREPLNRALLRELASDDFAELVRRHMGEH